MGNICRSPTAEGVFTRKVTEAGLISRFRIDSAGTHAYHIGNPPDPRTIQAAQRRGYDLTALRARKVEAPDFSRFDYMLAMDEDNLAILKRLMPAGSPSHVGLFMEFAPEYGIREVPDPYYGGPAGFEQVLDMVESAAEGLLEAIRRERGWD
jgi:protein-tyrosine phosphatase